jgi:antitoxin VapB
MTRSTVFTTNRSQAVRLPKPVAFPDSVHQVEITKVGVSRVISPAGRRWDEFFDSVPRVSNDFLRQTAEGPTEKRESL